MKRVFLAFILVLALVALAGCSGETTDGIKIPSSAGVYKGQDYQEVIASLEKTGFTNVSTEVLDDLVTGWMTKDGEVEHVSVDGEIKYNPDARYAADVKIVVTYHTFPTTESSENIDQPEQSSEPVTQDEILTIDNCEDLINVFSIVAGLDPAYKEFADKYRGRTIEFDGRIDAVANHSSYNSFNGSTHVSEYEYDILLGNGDFDPDTGVGPTMKIESISSRKLGYDVSKTLPSFMSVGSNIHVRARVGSYDEETGIFTMYYELIEAR